MKHIAIVTPCVLPVPASMGGAVEELITRIVLDNEIQEKFTIDLFSVLDDKNDTDLLSHTNVISIERRSLQKSIDKVLDKVQRTKGLEAYRLYDINIVDAFKERLSDLDEIYDAVIIENQVSTAIDIVNICRGNYEFPIYFHMHNDIDIYRSPKGIRTLASMGVQFIAVSEYIKGQILKCSGDAVVHVLYNGTQFGERCDNLNRKDSDKVRFLFAGRIIPDKGVEELVIAFNKLYDIAGDDLRGRISLDIIGFSSKQPAYEKKVQALANKHENLITCRKRISTSDMNKEYDQYDIVVMPTMNEEPFGLVALETMAKGLPLITTNSGALPEVVGDGAYIVDRTSDFTTKLANAMLELASDKEFREELGRKAYVRVSDNAAFDINNYYTNFAGIIDTNQNNDTISIVVPVYNVGDYLDRCVTSLLEQSYENIEVLLIDDGSTDGSEKKCDDYAGKDTRVKVIHQANQGLSGARNTGIDNASGEYIFFCDSDDFIRKDTIERLYGKLCKDNADVVACGFSHVWDDYEKDGREEIFTNSIPGTFNGHEAVKQMIMNNNICTVAWNKLYKRNLFENVRFPVGVLHEDEATTYKLLYKARIVSYTPEPLYKYFQRSESIMGKSIGKRGKHLITALTDRIRYFEDLNEEELVEYSRIALLDHIKYIYRNVDDNSDRKELADLYGENIRPGFIPNVAGGKKKLALLLWKYVKY